MSRRILITAIGFTVWLGMGCTASDREYVRNHIVHVETPQPHPATSISPDFSSLPAHTEASR